MHLTPCSHCERHVRSTDAACPFCDEPVLPTAPRPSPPRRLSRSALVAWGAALASITAACTPAGSTSEAEPQTQEEGTPDEASPDETPIDDIAPATAYGGAPMPEDDLEDPPIPEPDLPPE
ncbi:MAG: hypothetical protein JRH11_10885 [Deltaproteobacteria bacterium]|nr:hypothetical protein [Deltaproteobacteria bacterium]